MISFKGAQFPRDVILFAVSPMAVDPVRHKARIAKTLIRRRKAFAAREPLRERDLFRGGRRRSCPPARFSCACAPAILPLGGLVDDAGGGRG